jgi:hypothetical protein
MPHLLISKLHLHLQGEQMMTPHMLPPVAWQLPRLHSLVVDNPPSWRGLPLALALDHLVDLDLQVHTHCDTSIAAALS